MHAMCGYSGETFKPKIEMKNVLIENVPWIGSSLHNLLMHEWIS